MNIEQKVFEDKKGWQTVSPQTLTEEQKPQLVLVFGSTALIQDPTHFSTIRTLYRDSRLVFCSTAGEIYGGRVIDNSLIVTAIHFSNTTLQFCEVDIKHSDQSAEAGQKLAAGLPKEGLVHVLIFSD